MDWCTNPAQASCGIHLSHQAARIALSSVRLIALEEAVHAAAILDIFNDAILTSTALYDYQARTPASMVGWFAAKRAGNYPVIGAVSEAGVLMGFASFGTFRAWPAYKYTVEHSIYIEKSYRKRGLGRVLLEAIEKAAIARDVHVLVGGIDAQNAASIRLHEQCGFVHAGTIREAGFKFGRWLDLAFYQKILVSPDSPRDD
jgi:L-amino acid N-acyltransferase